MGWLSFWSLCPCVVLGYLSGRWWSFVGAGPVLVLLPFALLVGSSGSRVTGGDVFLTLPVAAAVAVALSLGSAFGLARRRRRLAQPGSLQPTIPAAAVDATSAPPHPSGPEAETLQPTPVAGAPAREQDVKRQSPDDRRAKVAWGIVIGSLWAILGIAGGLTASPADRISGVIGWVLFGGLFALAIWWLGVLLRRLFRRLQGRQRGGPPAAAH